MQKFLITAVLFVFCLGGVAHADGMYVKGNIGLFMPEDSDLSWEGEENNVDIGEASSNTGFGMTAAVGHSFGPLDLELEYGYREAGAGEISYKEEYEYDGETYEFPEDPEELDDSLDIKTFMINAIYNLENSTSVTPYAGVGFGGAWVEAEDLTNTRLAYQLMAGVGVELTKNATLLLGYRYLGMGDLTQDYPVYTPYLDENDDIISHYENGEMSGDMNIHNIEFGLKYSF